MGNPMDRVHNAWTGRSAQVHGGSGAERTRARCHFTDTRCTGRCGAPGTPAVSGEEGCDDVKP
jgi:hypothetical protein